jgi:hypothetical protein
MSEALFVELQLHGRPLIRDLRALCLLVLKVSSSLGLSLLCLHATKVWNAAGGKWGYIGHVGISGY